MAELVAESGYGPDVIIVHQDDGTYCQHFPITPYGPELVRAGDEQLELVPPERGTCRADRTVFTIWLHS